MSKIKEKIEKTDLHSNLIKCRHCNFITERRSRALIHIIHEHRPLRTPKCPFCGFIPENMGDAMNHLNTTHKNRSLEDIVDIEFIKYDKEVLKRK